MQPISGSHVAPGSFVERERSFALQLVRHVQVRHELRRAELWRLLGGGAVVTLAMVVVAALSWLGEPRRIWCTGESRARTTQRKLRQYVHEAYPMWASDHPDQLCPERLGELDVYMSASFDVDAWGTPVAFHCGPTTPNGQRITVSSAGEDRRFGTGDDLSVSD